MFSLLFRAGWIALVYWKSADFVLAVINSLFRAGGRLAIISCILLS